MMKFKSLAGSALIAAVAVGGAVASTSSAFAADAPAPAKPPAVGPYKCATVIPALSDDLLLASAYVSCDASAHGNPDTNVEYQSRLIGAELPDKKGPAIGFSILPKKVAEDAPGMPGNGGPDSPLPLPVPSLPGV